MASPRANTQSVWVRPRCPSATTVRVRTLHTCTQLQRTDWRLADMYSLALTTVSSLFKKYNVDPKSIGRLEVGTETLLDKSKSVKSVLMQLFEESGNHNVEGVDTVNACYGGTNALFNSVNWMESSAWDGRDAVVVAGDIALYKKGNARPTGGAGCVAILIGPDAPVVMDAGLRGSYITHAYDFFKPDFTSEYPVVDGHFSIRCYIEAVDACYKAYNAREQTLKSQANGANGHAQEQETPLDRFDYMCFHAPTCKLVAKSYARLLYQDFLENPSNPIFAEVPAELRDLDYAASITDKAVEKTFMGLAKKRFNARVQPSIEVPTMCGNMYCGSVYGSLCSLLSNIDGENSIGKRVAMFSYGSGLASSMFSFKIRGSITDIQKKLDVKNRLESRRVVAPEVYDEVSTTQICSYPLLKAWQMCNLRERAHLKKDFKPEGNVDTLFPGTYYLSGIDGMFRRTYEIKQ